MLWLEMIIQSNAHAGGRQSETGDNNDDFNDLFLGNRRRVLPTHVIKSGVGKLKTRVGKLKKNFGAVQNFLQEMFAHPGLKPCQRP